MIYAGFWRRAAALVIDALILLIPAILLGIAIPYAGTVVLWLLYKPFFESSPLQATPGKAFMGLKVVGLDGQTLPFRQSVIRYFLSIVSGMFLCVGYLFNLFSAKRQTFHDMVANAVVIESAASENIDWIETWRTEFKKVIGTPDRPVSPVVDSRPSGLSVSAMEDIDRLHKLYQSGALTEYEYEAKKKEILARI